MLWHAKFPVDIRHNAKIFREKLAIWAEVRPRMAAVPSTAAITDGLSNTLFVVEKNRVTGDGTMVNSRFLNGMTIEAAKEGAG